jgi:chromosome segregation ATPase
MEEPVTSLRRAESRASNQVGRVTLEDVKSAYEKLRAAGEKPSTRKVHEELGLRGSRTTIVKHYDVVDRAWKAAEPRDSPPLSPLVLGELARERDTLVKERTSQLFAELTDVRASLELVIEENEGFRAAAAEADSRLATLQLSLAEQSGIGGTLRSQGESLSKQLESANSEAESARQALALAREHLRAFEERVTRFEAQEGRTRNELAEARREAMDFRSDLEAKARECIALQAQVDSGRQLESRLAESGAALERLHAELQEARSQLAASEAQRSGLAERLKDAQGGMARAEATCEQLLRKVLETAPAPKGGETT